MRLRPVMKLGKLNLLSGSQTDRRGARCLPFSPTKGRDQVKTSMKLGNQ